MVKAHYERLLAEQTAWIAKCGGDLAGYIQNYHVGHKRTVENATGIYEADLNELHRLERLLGKRPADEYAQSPPTQFERMLGRTMRNQESLPEWENGSAGRTMRAQEPLLKWVNGSALLGESKDDGVMFYLTHHPTCHRRGPYRLLVEVCGGVNHVKWGCFDLADQPLRNYHLKKNALSEAEEIARVLKRERTEYGGVAQTARAEK